MYDLHLMFDKLYSVAKFPVVLYNKSNFPILYKPDIKLFRLLSSLTPKSLLSLDENTSIEKAADVLIFAAVRLPDNSTAVFGPFSSVPYEKLDARRLLELIGDKSGDAVQLANFFITHAADSLSQVAALLDLVNNIVNSDTTSVLERVSESETAMFKLSAQSDDLFSSSEYYKATMYQLIKSGNVGLLSQFDDSLTAEHVAGESASEYMRKCRNHAISCVTVAGRAAINGGLNYRTVKSLAEIYVREIERVFDINALNRLNSSMLRRYAELVSRCRSGSGESMLTTHVNNYIIRHINEQITGDSIAGYLGMNRTYLCQKFKKETGTSLGDHIKAAKMTEAKRLLSFSEYSILDVAVMLDYSTQSSFHNAFKAYTGMTPGDWRKTHVIDINDGSPEAFSALLSAESQL